ncbi:hypothetical protein, partial [Pseudodesulfovibrio sp. JC047]|uniref:hypothetical protein n=1 Tax=Pseudodesulfovibrio sp. JC047 TaxID=2683199 RepID=UPI00193F836B
KKTAPAGRAWKRFGCAAPTLAPRQRRILLFSYLLFIPESIAAASGILTFLKGRLLEAQKCKTPTPERVEASHPTILKPSFLNKA